MTNSNTYNNVINYPYIDYIIKSYVPELQFDNYYNKKVKMAWFKEAMQHVSTKFEDFHKTYERLEYLGDAIFHLIVTEYLYKRYDQEAEGFLTRLRIRIERGDSMADLTKKLNLVCYIQVYGISLNDNILEDVFEAFIGAFYLNFGLKYTKIFVIKLIEQHKNLSELILHDDNYKDLLLRYFHQMKWGHPIYEEIRDKNNYMTNKKKFISVVKNPHGKEIGKGISTSKKKAEQFASKKALILLGVIIDDVIDPDWINKIEKVEKELEEKEKDKRDKKPMPIYNQKNKLIKSTDIKKILSIYNVTIPQNNIDIKLFYEAMTHRSYLKRKKMNTTDKINYKNTVKLQKKSNERLQFLGDAVIHFIIGEYLYHKYPNADEGFLTRLRCKLENKDSLFYLAKQTDIDTYLLISQNIELLHGRNNVNIIGGGFEAFLGALYLMWDMSITKQFMLEVIRIELNIIKIAENETNYKDLILQIYNKNHWGYPEYKIIKEEGPDHRKIFTMGIYLKGQLMGQGKASSKKKAEQIASKHMYVSLSK